MTFSTKYDDIIKRIHSIDTAHYAKTRNHIDGAVSCLSPYITRGVITLPQVLQMVLENNKQKDSQKFIQELAWREFFQRVWEVKRHEIFSDLRFNQLDVASNQTPLFWKNHNTTIQTLDIALHNLVHTGYIHNHNRMWLASLTCNFANFHWWQPSTFMYYHLLDGDLASNSLSWQWVAGTFSSKRYTFNQDIVNACSSSAQTNTFLDFKRDDFFDQKAASYLTESFDFKPTTRLPPSKPVIFDPARQTALYHPWNLSPTWRQNQDMNRILILEPSHFKQFPVSERVVTFILDLAARIKGIQIFVGEIAELEIPDVDQTYFINHPMCGHFLGIAEPAPRLFPNVSGYFKNFFSYWKACQPFLSNH